MAMTMIVLLCRKLALPTSYDYDGGSVGRHFQDHPRHGRVYLSPERLVTPAWRDRLI